MSNIKLTVSKEIVRLRYTQEVLGGSKTAEQLAKELGISGSRLSRIVKPKAKPKANGGKDIYVSVSKDAKARDIADGILADALNDLRELQNTLRQGGNEGKTKALGLVHKVIRIIEVAKREPDITQIDARQQTAIVYKDNRQYIVESYKLLCDPCKKKLEALAIGQLNEGDTTQ